MTYLVFAGLIGQAINTKTSKSGLQECQARGHWCVYFHTSSSTIRCVSIIFANVIHTKRVLKGGMAVRHGPTTDDKCRIIRRFDKGVGALQLAIREVKIFSARIAGCLEEDAWPSGQGDSPPVCITGFPHILHYVLKQVRMFSHEQCNSRALYAEAYPVVVADPGQDAGIQHRVGRDVSRCAQVKVLRDVQDVAALLELVGVAVNRGIPCTTKRADVCRAACVWPTITRRWVAGNFFKGEHRGMWTCALAA